MSWRSFLFFLFTFFLVACASGKKQDVVMTVKQDAKLLNIRGNEFFFQGKYEDAAKFYDRARLAAFSIDDRVQVAESINNLGSLYAIADERAQALKAFEEALRVNRDIKNASGIATNLVNIASLQIDDGKAHDALKLLDEADALETNAAGKIVLLNQRGRALIALQQYQEASEVLTKALTSAESKKMHRLAAAAQFQLGKLYESQGHLLQALERYEEALRDDKLVEYSVGMMQDLSALGKVSEKLGEKQKAFAYYERAYLIAAELGTRKHMKENLKALLALKIYSSLHAPLSEYQRIYSKL